MRLPVASYNLPSRVPMRLVNCYAQAVPGSKQPAELAGTPGIRAWFTPTSGKGRGLFVAREKLYAAVGNTFYQIDADGTATDLGTLPGAQMLTFAANDIEVATSNKYVWNGTTLAQITDPDAPSFLAIDSVDGRLVYVSSGGVFGCSELSSVGSFIGTDFVYVNGAPDDLVTLKVSHRQVVLFGTESAEVYYNSGATFTFERINTTFIELGALAVHGVVRVDNTLEWLASDRTIRSLRGEVPQRISHAGMEERLAQYARVDDCQAFGFTWNGQVWSVWRFPSAGATWAYNHNVGEWSERQSYGYDDWRVCAAATCYGGRVFVQHADTGAVGELDDTCHTEWGEMVLRSWTYPQEYRASREQFFANFEVNLRTGDAPIGVEPQLMLEVSNDGGNTWLALPPRDLGQEGEYAKRIRWARLGSSDDRVFRCSMADPVPLHVLDTNVEVSA